MTKPDSFDDPVVGRLTRDPRHGQWHFVLLLPNGRTVPGVVQAETGTLPQGRDLERIRERLGWLRQNEPVVRNYITRKMYDLWHRRWYHEEAHPETTRDEFRDRIWLAGVVVLDDLSISLHYNDARLFGGRTLVLSMRDCGKFGGAPTLENAEC